MAKNYIQPGRTITLAAPYQRNAGEGALVGAIFGVALATVANGVNGEFAIEGVWDITKATGAITQGALVYWDNTNKNVTTTSTSNTRIGCATQAQASGDATVRVRLNGIATPTGA
jgi:predicted RecA/RadA family phage recombinase